MLDLLICMMPLVGLLIVWYSSYCNTRDINTLCERIERLEKSRD